MSADKNCSNDLGVAFHLPTPIMAIDTDYNVTSMNAAGAALLGMSSEACVGKKCYDLFKTDQCQTELCACRQSMARDEAVTEETVSHAAEKDLPIRYTATPLKDEAGEVVGAVEFILDMSNTLDGETIADFQGQLEAINKVQAVIEFEMDGTIRHANDNFLGAVGYALEEIVGKHHSIFVEPVYRDSPEYAEFWRKLRAGEYEAGEYKRIGKGGKEIWIQASYNPIIGEDGEPLKVVKYATDITKAKLEASDFEGQLEAISKAQAVIEFDLDGTIRHANENFLATLGYGLDEIVGRHHSLFVEPAYKASAEYAEFWHKLNRGEYSAGEYKRLGKGGKEVWIQASYNPILDPSGKPYKVVKYATDITDAKQRNADFEGQLAAINQAQAVIEFDLDGTIRHANENFLKTLGYELGEIVGRHHSLFVEAEFKESQDYAEFWRALNRGEYSTGEYKRLGKGGKEVWIQASYNPILDLNGKPFKVVKYATDVTEAKLRNSDYQGQLEAIGKAQAVIEFDLDGTIRHANENFLATLGYSLDEIVGRHHSMFVDEDYRASAAYADFWRSLNRGEFQSAQYRRLGKGGREVWIQASYNPIFDLNGKPFKVVKYATDITEQKSTLQEVARLISLAHQGQLDERAETEGATGDNLELRQSINALLDAIVRPLNDAVAVMEAMAHQDLTAQMQGDYQGRFAELRDNTNRALHSLNELLHEVVTSTGQVNDTANSLSASGQTLAESSQEQAAASEEISASVTETDQQIKTNAENAAIARQLVTTTNDTAINGRQEMEKMLNAMGEIAESSQSISKIMKVIDEIAFQTNILALNAAVEAARAGRHGRGFAVVAQEVRSLAGRSAKAAQETAELLETSSQKVQNGVGIAENTANALEEITSNVTKVKDLVAEIATASNEQAASINEVATGINQIAEGVTSVTTQSEESAAATEELSAIAAGLQDKVNSFTLVERRPVRELVHGLPSGMTPELLSQLASMLQAQGMLPPNGGADVAGHLAAPAPKPVVAPPRALSSGGDEDLEHALPLDTDARGYGDF